MIVPRDKSNADQVMDFLPGGDLMALLMKEDTFSEAATRQYMAEVAMAVNSVHELGYIHRDLKPGKLLRYTSTCRYDDANMRRKQREESEEDQKMVYTDTSFVLVNDYHSFPHQIIFCLTGMAT